VLGIFIRSRRALRGPTETPSLEESVPRGCDTLTLCSSRRPPHHVSRLGDENLRPGAGLRAQGTGSTSSPCLSLSNLCPCCIAKHPSLPQSSKHRTPWVKARLDGALSNLVWLKMSLLTTGRFALEDL